MNERLKELYLQAHSIRRYDGDPALDGNPPTVYWQGEVSAQRFAELIKQAIYDDVKEELIDDAIINEEPDRLSREYLKGCNGGTVDALCHIKNFGVDIEL